MDTRGLFQMRPTYGYLRASVENEYVTIRRTTFMATPADTITVYAAQGSTFDAVVADMQRPPHLDLAKHWLACYVMLSRAKSVEGFLVLRPATRNELSARPPQYLLDELDRLLQLETSSFQELVDYINDLPLNIPDDISHIMLDNAGQRQEAAVAKHRADVSKGESLRPPRQAVPKQTSAGDAQNAPTATRHASSRVPEGAHRGNDFEPRQVSHLHSQCQG